MQFPAKMYIDYIRIYQRSGLSESIGCDPTSHPTTDYIKKYSNLSSFCWWALIHRCSSHPNAYANANLTTWTQAGYTFPRNSQYDGC